MIVTTNRISYCGFHLTRGTRHALRKESISQKKSVSRLLHEIVEKYLEEAGQTIEIEQTIAPDNRRAAAAETAGHMRAAGYFVQPVEGITVLKEEEK